MRTAATFGCLLILLLSSCAGRKTSFQNEEELDAYVSDPENGYISSAETSDFLLEAKLVPAIAGDTEPQLTVHVRLSRKDGLSVLDFGGGDRQAAMEREQYLSFDVSGDAYFEDGENLRPAIFHHYERNYGLKPSVDLFFQFKHFIPKDDATFVYRDQLFGQGMFRIHFNQALFTSCHVEN